MSATIAARAHSSSTLSAPARRAASPRRSPPWLARLGRMVGRRPGRALVMLVFGGVAGAILVNAMMFQKTRHPAPIIAAPTQTPQARTTERRAETPAAVQPAQMPAALPASAPVPPTRPNDLAHAARDAQPRPPAAVTAIPRSAAAVPAPAAPAPKVAARDPIADLINGVDMRPPAEIRGGKTASARRTVEN